VKRILGVLGVAITLAARAAADPTSGSLPDCTCKDLPALEKDLENATELRNRFLIEAQTLNTQYPPPVTDEDRMASMAAEQTFTLHTAPDGIDAPPGYTGPSSVDYTPRNIDPDNLSKYKNAEQCEPGPGSRQDLSKAEAGSVCRGMAEAIRAHEKYHQDQCADVGSKAYFHKSGAEKATEEAAAYDAQITVLQAAIAKVMANVSKCFGVGHDTRGSLHLP